MSLDKKETYLWGTLLALVREQLDAINKDSSLGFLGKSRMQSRNKAMIKFVKKLCKHKISKFGESPTFPPHSDKLLQDLQFIEQDTQVWGNVDSGQLEYVSKMLAF